jgi:hypothetical protein
LLTNEKPFFMASHEHHLGSFSQDDAIEDATHHLQDMVARACSPCNTTTHWSWPPALRDSTGAGAAALAFNLLLVYAFLAPTRSTVAAIVREKELRLREGMRILGLRVGRP